MIRLPSVISVDLVVRVGYSLFSFRRLRYLQFNGGGIKRFQWYDLIGLCLSSGRSIKNDCGWLWVGKDLGDRRYLGVNLRDCVAIDFTDDFCDLSWYGNILLFFLPGLSAISSFRILITTLPSLKRMKIQKGFH
ncbi:unnamed protein product [Eruca vesicaria subsp. sativa]|uniref:Uncharacterized protein n=1 Tax=Eruca vesicaria subsp. sativa TaxID=29727 RepID=A0ABC8LS54_ERUVS|nr:unnamed protein product [Eruca vesicaria subsp. sativa]